MKYLLQMLLVLPCNFKTIELILSEQTWDKMQQDVPEEDNAMRNGPYRNLGLWQNQNFFPFRTSATSGKSSHQ